MAWSREHTHIVGGAWTERPPFRRSVVMLRGWFPDRNKKVLLTQGYPWGGRASWGWTREHTHGASWNREHGHATTWSRA